MPGISPDFIRNFQIFRIPAKIWISRGICMKRIPAIDFPPEIGVIDEKAIHAPKNRAKRILSADTAAAANSEP